MDLSTIKKTLAILISVSMLGAILMASIQFSIDARGQQQFMPQQYPQGQQYYAGQGGLSIPGLESIRGLSAYQNNFALSVSIASQEQDRTYFLVNSFAIYEPGAKLATLYRLSSALPGIMDTSSGAIQIDLKELEQTIGSINEVSVTDLPSELRTDVNTLMFLVETGEISYENGQMTFPVNKMSAITPDGAMNTFNMERPITAVFDSSSMRVYTVDFNELNTFVNQYVINIENNYYTTVITNIYTSQVITVYPTAYYPPLTPIVFPAFFPIYYPIPIPVHRYPTIRPPRPKPTFRPGPTERPTIRPTERPTIRPTERPTIGPGFPSLRPTIRPTIGPGLPSIRPTVRPTLGPGIPSIRPTTRPDFGPDFGISPRPGLPTFRPTARPTRGPVGPIGPTALPSRPTIGPGRVPVDIPTKQPVSPGIDRGIQPRAPSGISLPSAPSGISRPVTPKAPSGISRPGGARRGR